MDPRTGNSPRPPSRRSGERSAVSFRGEIALAAAVVAVYITVFGSSLFSLLGWGDAPDLLKLASDESPAASPVSEVLGTQSTELATQVPAAAAPTAEPTPVRAIVRATPTPAETPDRTIVRLPPATTQSTEIRPSVSGQHLVQSGDTLSELGELYHVDVGALKLINGLTSDTIFTGQTLAVPRPDEASQIGVSRLGDGGLTGD